MEILGVSGYGAHRGWVDVLRRWMVWPVRLACRICRLPGSFQSLTIRGGETIFRALLEIVLDQWKQLM